MKTVTKYNLPLSKEPSKVFGIFHLKRFWTKFQLKIKDISLEHEWLDEFNLDVAVLDQLGVGIEEVYSYIISQNSKKFSDFEQWILQKNNGYIAKERINSFNNLFNKNELMPLDIEPTLTENDLEFWEKNGFIVIPKAVSEKACRAVEQVIWKHLEMKPDDPNTWYKRHPDWQGIMVQLFQHEALEHNRFSLKIRKAYEQLWDATNLIVSNDRVSFNPPETKNWHFPGPYLHWDISLVTPIPFGLQGLLYLTDTTEEQGAFRLVPGFHHRIEDWLQNLPDNIDPRQYNLESLGVKPIAGKAGDFIIWHHALPHGSGVNTADRPRIVQYINWLKVDREHNKKWI